MGTLVPFFCKKNPLLLSKEWSNSAPKYFFGKRVPYSHVYTSYSFNGPIQKCRPLRRNLSEDASQCGCIKNLKRKNTRTQARQGGNISSPSLLTTTVLKILQSTCQQPVSTSGCWSVHRWCQTAFGIRYGRWHIPFGPRRNRCLLPLQVSCCL